MKSQLFATYSQLSGTDVQILKSKALLHVRFPPPPPSGTQKFVPPRNGETAEFQSVRCPLRPFTRDSFFFPQKYRLIIPLHSRAPFPKYAAESFSSLSFGRFASPESSELSRGGCKNSVKLLFAGKIFAKVFEESDV